MVGSMTKNHLFALLLVFEAVVCVGGVYFRINNNNSSSGNQCSPGLKVTQIQYTHFELFARYIELSRCSSKKAEEYENMSHALAFLHDKQVNCFKVLKNLQSSGETSIQIKLRFASEA